MILRADLTLAKLSCGLVVVSMVLVSSWLKPWLLPLYFLYLVCWDYRAVFAWVWFPETQITKNIFDFAAQVSKALIWRKSLLLWPSQFLSHSQSFSNTPSLWPGKTFHSIVLFVGYDGRAALPLLCTFCTKAVWEGISFAFNREVTIFKGEIAPYHSKPLSHHCYINILLTYILQFTLMSWLRFFSSVMLSSHCWKIRLCEKLSNLYLALCCILWVNFLGFVI